MERNKLVQPQPFQIPVRPKLSERDFSRISKYIHDRFGIKLPLTKLSLVESRLFKRVLKLNIGSFSDYVNFVFSQDGMLEQKDLIDFLCTNKTDFFREEIHFRFLDQYIQNNRPPRAHVNIWSAACASGEEPYTISMVLDDLKRRGKMETPYFIQATDISASILDRAIKGEYSDKSIEPVPAVLRKRYFTMHEGTATLQAAIKSAVNFRLFNLVNDEEYAPFKSKFDFVFCRNVLIYFDQATQLRVVDNIVRTMMPGGILFLGHTETFLGRNPGLRQIQPTIYQKIA